MLEFEWITYLRELNMVSMALRLTLALCLGGFIGMERERKGLPAGFRTYMLVCLGLFPSVEHAVSVHARNMVIYVEFYTVEHMTGIIQAIKGMNVQIFDIDFDKGKVGGGFYQPNAVITMKLPPKMTHGEVLRELSKLERVHAAEGAGALRAIR